MHRNRRGMTRTNVLVLMGVGVFGLLMVGACEDSNPPAKGTENPKQANAKGATSRPADRGERERAKRAACVKNIDLIGKAVNLYQTNSVEYPAPTNPATVARARELAKRDACAKNLDKLGKAIKLYQSVYSEKYPALTVPEPKPKATPMGAGNDRE
jgi:hypothetical protein